jgi:amidase
MKASEYAAHDALGLAALVDAGEITALEIADAAIDSIQALAPTLNAVIHEHFERARREARAPLPVVPFAECPSC